MRTPGCLALVAAALLVLAGDPALSTAPAGDGGPISRRGTYAGGRYVIEVPAGWNGGLVVFAHGYRGTEHSPLAPHLAANGYAWAGSSFRSDGYRPNWFLEDTLQLRELFIREVGRRRWTIIHGQAMGGHVAVASLDLNPGVYPASWGADRWQLRTIWRDISAGSEVEGPSDWRCRPLCFQRRG